MGPTSSRPTSVSRFPQTTPSANRTRSPRPDVLAAQGNIKVAKRSHRSTSNIISATAPPRNLRLPKWGGITAVELVTFLPQSLKSSDVMFRLVQNGFTTDILSKIIDAHRKSPKDYSPLNNSLRASWTTPMRQSGYEGWTFKAHRAGQFQPPTWDENDITLTGMKLQCENFPGKSGVPDHVIENVDFKSLQNAVNTMPSIDNGDAHILGPCVEYAVAHPDLDLQFPRDYEAIADHLGLSTKPVRPDSVDRAVAARWKAKPRVSQKKTAPTENSAKDKHFAKTKGNVKGKKIGHAEKINRSVKRGKVPLLAPVNDIYGHPSMGHLFRSAGLVPIADYMIGDEEGCNQANAQQAGFALDFEEETDVYLEEMDTFQHMGTDFPQMYRDHMGPSLQDPVFRNQEPVLSPEDLATIDGILAGSDFTRDANPDLAQVDNKVNFNAWYQPEVDISGYGKYGMLDLDPTTDYVDFNQVPTEYLGPDHLSDTLFPDLVPLPWLEFDESSTDNTASDNLFDPPFLDPAPQPQVDDEPWSIFDPEGQQRSIEKVSSWRTYVE
jgi:hypothetical protein